MKIAEISYKLLKFVKHISGNFIKIPRKFWRNLVKIMRKR